MHDIVMRRTFDHDVYGHVIWSQELWCDSASLIIRSICFQAALCSLERAERKVMMIMVMRYIICMVIGVCACDDDDDAQVSVSSRQCSMALDHHSTVHDVDDCDDDVRGHDDADEDDVPRSSECVLLSGHCSGR